MDNKIIYTAKNDPRQVVWVCLALFIAGGALFAAGGILGIARWALQLCGVIFLVAGIQLTARYILTSFIYVLDSDSFMVYRVNGQKRREVCSIYLDSCYALIRSPVQKAMEKEHGRFDLVYNHMSRISPPPEERYALLFVFNNRNAVLYIEAARHFAEQFENRINQSGK